VNNSTKHAFHKLIVILSIAWLPLGAIAAAAQDRPLAFTHVTVIDATGAAPLPDMTVLVEGKHIVQLGKSSQVHPPQGARIVAARGKYLIPGLWDMHVHTAFGDWLPPNEKVTLPLFVANGITGVRDMGSISNSLRHSGRKSPRERFPAPSSSLPVLN
jgi:adenine deaminase